MKTYEITFITKEEPKESSVKTILESFGGTITKTSTLGHKTFAYPIKKEKSGYYTSYLFDMEPDKMQDFNRKLDMEDEIIRHLIILLSPQELLAIAAQKENSKRAEGKTGSKTESKPETAIETAPSEAIEIAPVTEIEVAPTEEIVVAEEPTEAPIEKTVEKPVKKTVKKVEEPVAEDQPKTEKVKKETKEVKEVKKAKPAINENVDKAVNGVIKEEDRLEALDKKLEELLKD